MLCFEGGLRSISLRIASSVSPQHTLPQRHQPYRQFRRVERDPYRVRSREIMTNLNDILVDKRPMLYLVKMSPRCARQGQHKC